MASSTPSDIKTIAVLGTGVIGSSYAALFLAHGFNVVVSPTKENGAAKLRDTVAKIWPLLQMSGDGLAPGASMDNLEFVDDLFAHLHRVDLVQENGPENLEYKKKTFQALDAGTASHVPLISSTSGFPSSMFVTDCKHPERILNAHPFNPPHLIPTVEIIPHPKTSPATTAKVSALLRTLGQRPVHIHKETPGFVLNRLQAALVLEAYALVSRGVISAADLDAAVTGGIGLRWAMSGPFMNMALSGGGGAAGFRRAVGHLGPAAAYWKKDMDENQYVRGEEADEALCGRVDEMFGGMAEGELEGKMRDRNEGLMELVRMKKEKNIP